MTSKVYGLLMHLIAVVIITGFSFSAWGTDVGGIINTDTTWDLSGPTYFDEEISKAPILKCWLIPLEV